MKPTVVISGASSGIGAATARIFSQNGYLVVLLGRNKKRLALLQAELKNSKAYAFDLTKASEVDKNIKKILSDLDSPIEVLINNAGIYEASPFLKTKDEAWENMFSTNLLSAVRITRGLLPHMIKNKGGSIVNVSSTLGLRPTANTAAYSALKAALINLSQTQALELAEHQIRVNTVCPGIVDTPIHEFHHLSEADKQKALKQLSQFQPLGRIGQADEVAEAIFFLASHRSNWTTGAVLSVDGGINIK